MSRRGLLLISIGLNVILAVSAVFLWRAHRSHGVNPAAGTNATKVITTTRILPLVRKQFFSWNELESDDYGRYIANLRDIGCPEQTIRDIIVADVNKLYDERKLNEDQTSEHFTKLDEERGLLLVKLLGADWDATEKKTGFAFSRVVFTDPLLDQLTPETRAKVQEILNRWSQQAVPDERDAALLEQKMRAELAGVLAPPQLEELLSRYSANAINLNHQLAELQFFKATPEEFRQLFRGTDALDLQLRLLGSADDPATQAQRKALTDQRDLAIKTALGSQRYAEFAKLQDPAYRESVAQAQANGGSPQGADAFYKINQAVANEQTLIQANANLTDLQRQIELKKLELAQLQAQAQVTGQSGVEPPMPPTPTTTSVQRHLIAPNETLVSLAAAYGMKVSDILAANPSMDFRNLKAGDSINIPVKSN